VSSAQTRIDEIVGGIYRISTWQEPYGITFNQFLVADDRPALIHTGMHHLYDDVRKTIGQVLDPTTLTTSSFCIGKAMRTVAWTVS
jgi:flavorubredoxin